MEETECSLCGYEITDPICVNCLKKGVLDFLEKRPHLREDIEILTENLKNLKSTDRRCVTCKRKIRICDYCFNTKVYHLLKEKSYNISEEFGRSFSCGTNMVTPEFQFQY